MREIMETIPWPFYPGLVTALATTLIWYKIKAINRIHGYAVSLWRHYDDLKHFRAIICNEIDTSTRDSYLLILRMLYLSLGLTILLFLAAMAVAVTEKGI